MYAVIETGGKQYKVGLGDRLKVEKLAAKEGDSIDIGRVLMIAEADQITFGKNASDKPVKAQVLGHGRRKKMKVFKKKRRKGYRRTQGHRQDYTELRIIGIGSEILDTQETVLNVEETVVAANEEVELPESNQQDDLENKENTDAVDNPNSDTQQEGDEKTE